MTKNTMPTTLWVYESVVDSRYAYKNNPHHYFVVQYTLTSTVESEQNITAKIFKLIESINPEEGSKFRELLTEYQALTKGVTPMIELQPCPFCGGTPSTFSKTLDERMGYLGTFTVQCSCGASISKGDDQDGNGWSVSLGSHDKTQLAKHKAITAWNTRVKELPQ